MIGTILLYVCSILLCEDWYHIDIVVWWDVIFYCMISAPLLYDLISTVLLCDGYHALPLKGVCIVV